jgi:hypothetical protein
LIENGTPWSGPSEPPAVTARSAASALVSACSAISVTTALIFGFTDAVQMRLNHLTRGDLLCSDERRERGRVLIMDGARICDLLVEHSCLRPIAT